MRKLFAVLAVLALPSLAFAGHKPKACTDSVLCVGLIEHYDFEEASDSLRLGSAAGGTFEEPGGQNVANTVSGKFGNAVVLGGTSTAHLDINPSGNFGTATYTMAFWIYPTTAGTAGQTQAIISTDSTNSRGETLYLINTAGSLYPAWEVYRDSETNVTITSSTSISINAWHLIVVGVKLDFFTSSNSHWITLSVDNGALQTASLPGPVKQGFTQINLGRRPSGSSYDLSFRMDSFSSWGRALTSAELTLLYNSGSGRAFPFSTP